MDYKYYYFGSADSLDTDVLVDHPDATGTEGDINLIKELETSYPVCCNWNVNIVKIEDGFVTKSIPSKGTVDSVNNSLFQTYDLHEQEHPQPLKGNLKRHELLALTRCIRAILISVKKTPQYKANIRAAMKGSFQDRIDALSTVSYSELSQDYLDRYKQLAFRIGQTLSLMGGREIYTKADFINNYPDLADIINRVAVPVPGQMEALIARIHDLAEGMNIKQTDKNTIEWQQLKVNFQSENDIQIPV